MQLHVALDRTTTIRASIKDVTRTLIISVLLVILVVFVFLREVPATLIPSVSVPLSLLGTCGIMYLLGYTLDNLSLMALTISTGFVVDDAIVVIENISRHLESGKSPFQAAMDGSQRDRLYGDLDEHVADRGVHSHPADGRDRWQTVPRVRGDLVGRDYGFAGGFADDDSDAEREVSGSRTGSASMDVSTAGESRP